jgi:hypothetical protein
MQIRTQGRCVEDSMIPLRGLAELNCSADLTQNASSLTATPSQACPRQSVETDTVT